MNHYKDQEEDLEKYKLICKFISPEAADKLWGRKDPETTGFTPEEDLLQLIAEERGLDPEDLRDKLHNPKDYDNLDTIERLK